MRLPNERLSRLSRGARAACALALAYAVFGCASMPETPSAGAGDDVRADAAARRERSRRELARIETDEVGFTITERLRVSGEARADYQLALDALRQGRYEQGIAGLLEVIELAPDVTAPHIDLGIAYGEAGELEAAESALLDALALTPEHPVALNELGIVYRKTGRFAAARESYEKALEVYPGFHYARRNLGVLCDLYLADLSCALENYEAYLGAVVEDDDVSIWVADIRARLGAPE